MVTAFRDGRVTLRTNRRTDGFTEALQEHGYQGVRRGELVIHSMDGFAGAIGVSDSDGKMSPVAHIYDVRDGDADYFAHLLRVMAGNGFVESLAKGIRERSTSFDRASFRALTLPVPPVDEQRQIVSYLDRETAQIDAFIAKNEELIALLLERKLAVSSRLATRGLNPNGPLRASGYEWLGDIPKGWNLVRFRYLFRESSEVNGDEPVGVMLSVSGLRGVETKRYEHDYLRRDPDQVANYRVVRPGQLAVNSMWMNYAGLGISDVTGHVSPAYRAYWVSERLVPRYAHHLLRSAAYVDGYTALLKGIRPNSLQMSRNDLMDLPVLVPPRSVQNQIANRIDTVLKKVDQAIDTAQIAVKLARERRAALISAAVTGKIDVGVTV